MARVDQWLWAVRLAKTRAVAAAACRAGHVTVDGKRAKPAAMVVSGTRVVLRGGERLRDVVVRDPIIKRVGAALAVTCFEDHSPPPLPREFGSPQAQRERGAGRPTKRDRRDIDRLRGRR